jgi:6-pyruvoyltetrahydropterin/6-carboxytetrahydropterin synthase
MYRVSREIDFCYGHRLLNYDGKCKYLHGHNGRAVIVIEAPDLDDRGMVMDFSDIKRVVSSWIDEHLDHRMLLHREDPMAPILEKMGEPVHLLDVNPTAENIAKLIHEVAASHGFPIVETHLWETPRCYATYKP